MRTATVLSLTVFLVILLLQLLKHRPYAAGLAVSTALVGWAGGRWFVQATWNRDKVIAIAAAALFVAISAYEYDTGGLRNITKFSAGSVDVELSPDSRSRASDQSYGGTTTLATDPFPGRSKLKLALYYLDNLPALMERDERYAELFSGYDKIRLDLSNKTDLTNGSSSIIDNATNEFQNYYKKIIAPYTQLLDILQTYHKGETASISLENTVIRNLRLVYEKTLTLAPMRSSEQDLATALCESARKAAESPRSSTTMPASPQAYC